ncbi:hypothetical protein YN1_7620 [Nanoarchaeota archaeon]
MEIFDTKWKVLIPIFKYPTKGLSIREIAKLSGISHTYIIKIIKELENENLITIERKEKINLIRGNLENKYFIELKRLYNILSLKDLVNYLVDNYSPDVIILFGSYSYGTDTEKSDIDLYIGYKNFEINLEKFEKELSRKIQVFSGDIKNYPKELLENILNGVKLYGWIKI